MGVDPRVAKLRREFESLYERYSREVWSTVYARWLDAESATDITQEAFLRLWKQLESGETIQSPRAWLVRVARNLAEDQAKSAFHRYGTQAPEVMNGVRAVDPAPLDKMERDEFFAKIRSILDELSVDDRTILTLRYALDYDSPQIAEVLGVNVTAIHMRLSRARQRLAEKLAVHGVEPKP